MNASLHPILSRQKAIDIAAAQPTDFTLGPGAPVGAELALEAGWSLYCLDFSADAALFVQLAADADIADAAFSGLRQFDEARQALLVPLDALEPLASQIAAPKTLVLIYGMGRCGTTLAHWMLNRVGGVRCVSEPGALNDLALAPASLAPERRLGLIRAATRLLTRAQPGRSEIGGAIKFRSQTLFAAEIFREALPEAKSIFMYRDGLGWANSRYETSQRIKRWRHGGALGRAQFWRALAPNMPLAYLDRFCDSNDEAPQLEAFYAALWTLHLQEYDRLQTSGMRFLAIDYATLNNDRAASARRLLRYCGLDQSNAEAMNAAFAADSQAGTTLSRDNAVTPMSPAQNQIFLAALRRHVTIQRADYQPGQSAQ